MPAPSRAPDSAATLEVVSRTQEDRKITPVERLSLLADRLEEDALNSTGIKFDLDFWGKIPKRITDPKKIPLNCNTAACAVGLAMLLPEFQEEGLKTEIYNGTSLIPHFNNESGFEAVSKFFGLSYESTYKLFRSDYYNTSKGAEAELEVAKRIRETIAEMNG